MLMVEAMSVQRFRRLHKRNDHPPKLAGVFAFDRLPRELAVVDHTFDIETEMRSSEFALRRQRRCWHVHVVSRGARVFRTADVQAGRYLLQHLVCRVNGIHGVAPEKEKHHGCVKNIAPYGHNGISMRPWRLSLSVRTGVGSGSAIPSEPCQQVTGCEGTGDVSAELTPLEVAARQTAIDTLHCFEPFKSQFKPDIQD